MEFSFKLDGSHHRTILVEHVVQYFKHVFVGSCQEIFFEHFTLDHILFAMKIMIEKEEFLVSNSLRACNSIIVVSFGLQAKNRAHCERSKF